MASGMKTFVVVDGPIAVPINKRIRNLRKKLKRIEHLEDLIAKGKSFIKNRDQEKRLKSKPMIIAEISELEKLFVAVGEEITPDEDCNKAKKSLDTEQDETEQPDLPVLDLIQIGCIFDGLLDERNRGSVYEYLICESSVRLTHYDWEMILLYVSQLISRAVAPYHQKDLERCNKHARLWVTKSEQQIVPDSAITYAGFREKLTKIMEIPVSQREENHYESPAESDEDKDEYQPVPSPEGDYIASFLAYGTGPFYKCDPDPEPDVWERDYKDWRPFEEEDMEVPKVEFENGTRKDRICAWKCGKYPELDQIVLGGGVGGDFDNEFQAESVWTMYFASNNSQG